MWHISDHVCRHCLGRLLYSRDAIGQTRYRCADCGAEHTGDVDGLCMCGAKLTNGANAGFICIRNPNPTAGAPQQIVAAPKVKSRP